MAAPKTLVETLLHLFPSNVVDAMAKQDILQVVIFATLVGVAAAHVQLRAEPFLRIMDSIVAVMFQLTDYVMSLTPLGVFGAMAGSVSHHGLSVLGSYAKLVASLYGALVLFALLVLVPALLIARAPIGLFFRKIREPFLLAFSTASSEAALPAGAREDGRVRRARVGGRLRDPGRATRSTSTARRSTSRSRRSRSRRPRTSSCRSRPSS